ncbi:MAG: methyltransferase domain-containing protein [Chloroflexi bacterium]|nr:methyltransferase domain-containing protein [Chloroflexota bacterium]MCC6897145.1 methyltransferase domain-containing protein [Anaerolineae bacterium]
MSNEDVKAHAQQRFGQFAQGYVESKGHSSGGDLNRLVELAQPQPDWLMMDVATGGGHTALKFAPLVGQVMALDLTPKMLDAASRFIRGKDVTNVAFAAGDAEQIPFADNTFDLVTCRIAAHHFPNCWQFVQEVARVLKPGGKFILQDNTVPDDERAARYVDAFERLRDPSHHRMYAGYEWQGMFLDAGLTVETLELAHKRDANLIEWATTQGQTQAVIERLQVMMVQAPDAARAWLNPHAAGTPDATFDHHYVVMVGRKG